MSASAAASPVLNQVINRAANGYERWVEQVVRTGYCSHPIRLMGSVSQADKGTGEVRMVYSTEDEPDKTLLIACGNRRESRCPSCSETYRGDAFQLVSAGLKGGKGVPPSVAEHPMLFITFTAPSFGPVHAVRSSGSTLHPCRPRRAGRCRHGIPLACWKRHEKADACVGQPLCGRCFDYEGQVLWNALAPELWRRTTIAIRRELAKAAWVKESKLASLMRLSYVKVAEYQRRGALHFHAVLRLDGPQSGDSEEVVPPAEPFTVEFLEEAVRTAAARVSAPCPVLEEGSGGILSARWGEQLEVRQIGDHGSVELSGASIAGYVAKYATKSSESLWPLLEVESDEDLEHLNAPTHIARLVRAGWELGGKGSLSELKLRKCAHALGFKGHWSTKSRRYSTTFKALRCARRKHTRRKRWGNSVPLDAWGRRESEEAIVVRPEWRFAGTGYKNQGEVWLAMSAAARARERRRIAKEELWSRVVEG